MTEGMDFGLESEKSMFEPQFLALWAWENYFISLKL